MILAMIAALDANRAIGHQGKTPWHLPADLRWFKNKTLGKPVISGRKTYESVGHALPGRYNIVVTRRRDYTLPDAQVVHTFDEALAAAEAYANATGGDEIMILGGADVFAQLLPHADRLYLTYIAAEFEGDAFFPAVDPDEWVEVFSEAHDADDENHWPYTFVILERPEQTS
jgi:dihydrofolate reductase